MTLGERIKAGRKQAELSQEQLAELIGVSRQAVTKWETNHSAPSTENLFRLADILGTSVDLLLTSESPAEQSAATPEPAQPRRRSQRNLMAAVGLTVFYVVLYGIGRLLFSYSEQSTVLGWLFLSPATGPGSYLFGWLVDNHLFFFAMGLSVLPTVFGKIRFSLTTSVGFLIGLLTGMLFGPNPAGTYYGNTHYGWAIWLLCFLVFMGFGCVLERMSAKGLRLNSKAGIFWLTAAAVSVIFIIVFVRLSIPDYSLYH